MYCGKLSLKHCLSNREHRNIQTIIIEKLDCQQTEEIHPYFKSDESFK